jgi:DNA-binding MarR family transcriptional regulator
MTRVSTDNIVSLGNEAGAQSRRRRSAAVIRLAVGRASRRLRQEAGSELTPSQASVLATIARNGPIRPSDLARDERLSRPTVSKIVAKLRVKGLVYCTPDGSDGRSYQIEVSPDGTALRELRRVRKNSYLERLLRHANKEETELLEAAARLLLKVMDEADS